MTLVFDYNGIVRACKCNHRGEGHCPAHRDENPSFKVTRKDDGKVMVHCLAGCTQSQVIAALERLGLVWNEKKPRPMTRPPTTYGEGDENYHKLRQAYAALRVAMGCVGDARKWRKPDAQKALTAYFNGRHIDKVPVNALFLSAKQSKRLGGKHYPCMVLPVVNSVTGRLQAVLLTYLTPDATRNLRGKENKSIRRFIGPSKGGYVVLGRIKKERPLIVAEGVENALSLSQITGLPAIAALGAGNMKAIALPPSSEVIIGPDNDSAGGEAAEALTQRLVSSGSVVRVVPPRRPPGRDKYDWNEALKDGQTDGTKFAELRDKILSVEPEAAEPVPRVTPLGMRAFMELVFPPRRFLLQPWLTTTGLVMMDAQAGHGKTWLALSVAYAVASGTPLLGWEIEQRGRVLYVDGELPGSLLQKRLRALGPQLSDKELLVLSRSQFEMRGLMMPDLGTKEGREYLDEIIDEYRIDLIILDSVSTLVRSGVDNDVESWRAIQEWSLTHRAQGRAVIYLHHHGRSGNPRGTSAREIVLDARIKLERDLDLSTDKETAFKLEFPKAREFFGADAAPLIAFLSTPEERVQWRRESVQDNTRQRVTDLSKQGWTVTEIAKELNLTKGRISQILKEIRSQEVKSVKGTGRLRVV